MKLLNIYSYTINSRRTTMNKKKITEELYKRLDVPFKDFMSSAKRYFEQPSIPNGARRQEARDHFDEALRKAAEYALEKWGLTPEEFNKIIDGMMEYK